MRKVRTIVEYLIPNELVSEVSPKDLECGFRETVEATINAGAILSVRSDVSEFYKVEEELKCPKCGSTDFEIHTKIWVQDNLCRRDGKWIFSPDDVSAKLESWVFSDADEVYCANCGVEIPKEKLEDIKDYEWDDC